MPHSVLCPAASKQKVQERFDSAGRAVHPTAQRLESQVAPVLQLSTRLPLHAVMPTYLGGLRDGVVCAHAANVLKSEGQNAHHLAD